MTTQSAGDQKRLFREAMALHQQGRRDEAEQLYRQMLAAHADSFEALYGLGMLLMEMQRPDEALASLDRAVAIRGDHSATWNNRGNVLRALKRPLEALTSFDKALAIRADAANAHYNRANVLLLDLRRPAEALAAYDQVLALKPDFAEAWNNRGNALSSLGRLEDALASFDHALALRPDFTGAMNCRGHVLLETGRVPQALAQFERSAAITYGGAQGLQEGAPPHRLRHDQEQRDYRTNIAGHGPAGARIAGPAVTPGNTDATRDWKTRQPQIAVIDDFLTPESLEELRRFCLESPVWQASNANGYLGAFPEHGFACPLLGQIAEELRAGFPEIFRDHPLLYLWGFKYDSQLSGTSIHADEAAVNVNFWLTPDEANLDATAGGLVLWDKAAPLDWDFAKFNSDTGAIRSFLGQAGAQSVTVPYRANRAVIFDSDLFHETDAIRFKDGYQNRRINVTMLFGRRDSSKTQ